MVKRWQEDELCAEISARQGIHLTGIRQSGKKALVKRISSRKIRQLNLDDGQILVAAKNDPVSFVDRRDNKQLAIAEIQRAPELFGAIKIKLDNNASTGQYLVSSSSNLLNRQEVIDPLVDRLGCVRLRTLALGELRGGKGDFISRAFARDFPATFDQFDKRDVIHEAFCGGYPEARSCGIRARRRWFDEYLRDLLTRDAVEATVIRKRESLRKVAHWMMANSAKFFRLNDLCQAAQIGKETLAAYLEALQAVYLVEAVPPWAGCDYAKRGKRQKYFASDPGLVANLLGWNEDKVYYDDDKCTVLVKTWVGHELAVLADLAKGCVVEQYRDSDKREVDFVVKAPKRGILGITVKVGTVSEGDFKQLKWFHETLYRGKFTGIVLYSGCETRSFGEGFYAVPFSALAL